MKSVLISIQAEHNANVESGRKLSELRTRVPKCELPIKFYTYESGKNGRHKITNEWICREIREYPNPDSYPNSLRERACVPFSYICDYSKDGEKILHELVISDLKIYDKPRELSEFYHYCGDDPKCDGCEAHYFSNTECGKEDYCCSPIEGCKPLKRPPQSWCYVERSENGT